MDQKKFKWRSFVSFGMFFAFLTMSISGLILYIAPPGRVFRWTDWHFLWIDLEQWQTLHTLFSYLFLGFALSHVFSMNWKILFSYFTRKTKAGLRRKRELIASSFIILLFIFGSLFSIPPFKSIMDMGSWASGSWGKNIDYPPVAHAEEMTIEKIAQVLLNVPVDDFSNRIKLAGFEIDDVSQTLAEVCKKNHVAPYEFFRKTTEGMKVLVIPDIK
ncbi:MAG: DUF4405 domain-containing protein [Prolixibacteraceae bacterium]